jgi:small subunit ribosomal protein S1
MAKSAVSMTPTRDDFMSLLEESYSDRPVSEGSVVKGKVLAIENELVIIDVGLKTEGRVPVKEFAMPGKEPLKAGDIVEVYLDRIENALGEAVLSRDKAKREEAWTRLEEMSGKNERVDGVIFGRVKGGFTVDLGGAVAFLPGSQVDVRPIRDVGPLMHISQPFQILKMDRRRGNIVVSRRAIMEETRAEQRSELVQNLAEGQVVDGVVKNITDYGAFVDLGGIDGLLHVTDIAWKRVNHPSDVLAVGQTVKVQIIRINPETQRISLGMKQLDKDPWDIVTAKYPVGTKVKGKVTNITDYGAFVELEDGIEGLIHVSEMSWTKKNVHPGKILSTSEEIDVQVLEIDNAKRRISLGLKQVQQNPWETFSSRFPKGTIVEGEVKNTTEFGLFIGLEGDVDGMVHLSDIDWKRPGEEAIKDFKKGDHVKAVVLDIDQEKERISLGIKQLTDAKGGAASGAPAGSSAGSSAGASAPATGGAVRKGSKVTCEVLKVEDGGLEVRIAGTDMTAYVKRADLARDRGEQRPERFSVGEKFDAIITMMDAKGRKINASIKQLEITDEREAVAQYGSSDSGASLGDILQAAMKKKDEEK